MTPQEKLAKIEETVERHKKMLLTEMNPLEITAFYLRNKTIYEEMIMEIEKITAFA